MSNTYSDDPDVSAMYAELLKRGVFKADPDAAAMAHELRRRGVIKDPTQGGLVKPPPATAQQAFDTGTDRPDPNDPYAGPRLAPQKPLYAAGPNALDTLSANAVRNAKQIGSDVVGYGSNLLNTAVQSAGIDEEDLPGNAARVAQPVKTFVKANAAIAPRAAKIQTIIARMRQIADRGTPEAAKEYAGHVAQLKAMGVPASAYGGTTAAQDSAATFDLAKQAGNFAYNNPIDAALIGAGGIGEAAEGIGSMARIADAMGAGSKAGRVARIADTAARLSHGAATGGVSEIARAARGGATAEEAAHAATTARALEPLTSLPENLTTPGLQAARASKPILPPPAETTASPLQALATAEAAIPKPQPVEAPAAKRAIARMRSKGATSPAVAANTAEANITPPIAKPVSPALSAAKPTPEDYKNYPVEDDPKNINQLTWYHGTGSPGMKAQSIDAMRGDPENLLMGNGFYLTTNPDIAAGYAEARSKRGGVPTVYQAKVNLPGGPDSIINADKPLPEAAKNIIQEYSDNFKKYRDGYNENLTKVLADPQATFAQAIKAMKLDTADYSQDYQIPKSEFIEDFQNLASDLRKAGYDAITHTGGARTGHTPHQAMVLLDPNDAISNPGLGRGGQVSSLDALPGGVEQARSLPASRLTPPEARIASQGLSHVDQQISSGIATPQEANDTLTRLSENAAKFAEPGSVEPASEPAGGSTRGNGVPDTTEVQPAAKSPAPRERSAKPAATALPPSEVGQAAPGSASGESKPVKTQVTPEAPLKGTSSPVQAEKTVSLPITQNEAFTVQDSLSPELRGKLSTALKSKGTASVDLTPSEIEEVRAANAGTKYPNDPDVKSLRAKLMETRGAAPERGTRLATEPPKMAGGAPNNDPFRGLKTAIAKAKNILPAAKQSLFSDAVQESIDNTKAVTSNLFSRRFSRTIKESPTTYEAVRQMAGAKGQAHVSALTTLPQISEAMNRGTAGIKQFNSLMVENRLRGIRKMWQEAATRVQSLDPTAAGVGKSYTKELRNLVENAGDRSGVTGALKDADALAKAKDYQGLKNHLENVFASSASNVPAVPLGPKADAFETETARPQFQKALKIYQEQMEGPMRESHLSNGGTISGHLGPLDTYYPLIAEDASAPKGTEPIGLRGRTGVTAPEFKAPLNRHNHFATGLADRYSVDPKHLLTEMARSYRTNSRANLINVARSEGILTDLPKGAQKGPDTITYKGRQVPATTVMTKAPVTIAMKGKTFTKPGQYAVMPTSLYREMHEMLNPDFVPKDDANIGRNAIGFLNGIAVKGFAEPVFHGTNVLGTLVNNTPFVGIGEATIHGTPVPKVLTGIQKVLGNTFVTKGANAVYNLAKIKTDTPEFAQDMMRLAKMGLVPTRTGEITTSAKYAAMTGAKQAKGLGVLSAALFGPSGLDTRARVLMLRIADQAAPLASEAEKAKFVEQLGLYNHELESKLVTGAKYSGLGPFATAGTQMNKNAALGMIGRSPLPRGGNTATQHALNRIGQLSASTLGATASWIVTHKAVTGKWPWQDKNARPMAIPVPTSVKNSTVGKQLWHGPGTAYLSLAPFSPLADRALRVTGVGPAALAFTQAPRGSKAGIAAEEGMKSILNSNIHPYISGTATRAAFNMFGVEPSLTGLRDSQTGRVGPQFFPSSDTKQPGLPQLKENVKETLLNLNPSVGNAAEDLGFGRQQGKTAGGRGRQIGKAIADIVAPRAVSGTYDANEASGRYDRMIQRIKSKENRGIKLAPGGLNAIK